MLKFAKIIRILALLMCFFAFIIALLSIFHILSNTYLLFTLVFFSVIGFLFLICFSLQKLIFFHQKNIKDINILDELPEAIVITDMDGNSLEQNGHYKKLVSHIDHSPLSLLQKWNVSTEQIYRLFNGAKLGKLIREEVRVNASFLNTARSNNNASWYILETCRALGEGHIIWRIIDVTADREDQENYFRDLQEAINHLDFAPVGFASCDAQGNLIYINASLSMWTNYDLATFLPSKFKLEELLCNRDKEKIHNFLAKKQDGYISSLNLEFNNQPIDLFVNWQLYGENEAIARIVITPCVVTSEAIDNKSILFNEYFENNSISMAIINPEANILKQNKSFDYFIGNTGNTSSLSSLIVSTDRERFERFVKTCQSEQGNKQRRTKTFETALNKNENQYVTFYFCPLGNELSGDNIIVVSIVETTQMRVLEEQMLQSQKMQAVGQLAGGIAHDFNNVLTAIIMSCDLLLASHRTSDPSHPDLMNIKLNANRAASLVQQLLAFSRRQTLLPQVVDLPELLSSIMNMVAPALGTHIKVETLYTRDLWSVEVDKGSFDQVITNLVFNARDAMPGGGVLSISTRNLSRDESKTLSSQGIPDIDYVAIEVKDTGTGIPEDIREKIFEPFFTTKEVGKGTGLGLSMVYGIIKQTNGYIFCTSKMGKGTTFHILLPRYDASAQKVVETSADEIVPKSEPKSLDLSGTATVLLVEDEDAVRMGGVRALQSRGYTVLEAASGVEALEVLEEHDGNVDIVVSDVVMPEMDGPTLLGELRKSYPDIKFIFVSGYAKDAFAKNLPEDAEFGFLAKPFSLKELASAVKNMLSE